MKWLDLFTAFLNLFRRDPQPLPDPQPQPNTLSETARGLIEAGKEYNGAHVCESENHPLLQKLATQHAKYMAMVRTQGHQGFQLRYDQIYESLHLSAAEICAETWKWQASESPKQWGLEAFKCWQQSPGHWKVASKKHKFFGAEMAKGSNGVVYACILVAD